MLLFLGKPVKNPYAELFDNFKPYDASLDYPSIENVKKEWQEVSVLLKDAIESVTEEQLAANAPIKNPSGDFTNGGTLAFLAQHESYTIGQMSFLKKYFTKEAMSYN
jgi:DinB superfamily